ncbi:MAG: site-specific integrase [Planctomycetota bacterium]|nr:MAG: site-specific integrase [Planctomycetota bacterium]
MFSPILKAAGIEPENECGERVVLHSLRHTCATRLARAGWPMAKLQKFMGHTDPRTTQRYYDHLEVEDLEVALDLVPELPAISGSKLALRPEERGPVERRSGVSGE